MTDYNNYTNYLKYSKEERGVKAEQYFSGLTANRKGITPTRANRDDDMFQHWDYDYNGVKVDVKAMKCNHNKKQTFLEFSNRNGLDGWLYGIANYIAFQSGASFIVTNRTEVLDMSRQKMIIKRVDDFNRLDSLYCLHISNDKFSGNKAKDLIMSVRYQDLIDLPSTYQIIDKNNIIVKYYD